MLAQKMAAHLFQPIGFNVGNASAKQPCGLHQFRHHGPTPGLLGQVRARMPIKLNASRTQVNIFVVLFASHIAQQACQHRQMNLLVGRRLVVELPTVFRHGGVQLCVGITPLTHTSDIDKILTQQLFVLAVAEFVFRARSRFTTTRL